MQPIGRSSLRGGIQCFCKCLVPLSNVQKLQSHGLLGSFLCNFCPASLRLHVSYGLCHRLKLATLNPLLDLLASVDEACNSTYSILFFTSFEYCPILYNLLPVGHFECLGQSSIFHRLFGIFPTGMMPLGKDRGFHNSPQVRLFTVTSLLLDQLAFLSETRRR